MENSRTPRKTPDTLCAALADALDQLGCDPAKPLAVAFSGGMDSTVLLHVAHRLAMERATPLFAFHIHHGLSPNAAIWAAHCVALCEKLGINARVAEVGVPAQASLEAAARDARYLALAHLCTEAGVATLLTAHHLQDQAETVLLNVLRGTGISGLRGIASSHRLGNSEVLLVRPWLGLTRSSIESYAKEHALTWIEDESNANLRYRRNALRHGALKTLEADNPDVMERLGALARHAASADRLLDDLAALDLLRSNRMQALELAAFAGLDLTRRANLLRFWLKTNNYGVPDEARLLEWLRQIETASPTLRLTAGSETFIVRNGALKFEAEPDVYEPPQSALHLAWDESSVLKAPAWHGCLYADRTEGHGVSLSKLRREGIELRSRIGGERLKLHENQPSRTLKNLYQEAQIDATRRNALPLVYCKDQLIFAAGLGMNVKACSLGSDARVTLRWESDPSAS